MATYNTNIQISEEVLASDGNGMVFLGEATDEVAGLMSAADKVAVDANISLAKKTVTVGHADLTDAVDGEAQVINIGTALPANAVVLAHEVLLTTQFTGVGVAACDLDIGGTDADAIVAAFDVLGSTAGATVRYSPGYDEAPGIHPQGKYSAQQLVATFTPDGAANLNELTAGALTITVWYTVLA